MSSGIYNFGVRRSCYFLIAFNQDYLVISYHICALTVAAELMVIVVIHTGILLFTEDIAAYAAACELLWVSWKARSSVSNNDRAFNF